jgi:hypothetical protein
MFRVFNMGIGMVAFVAPDSAAELSRLIEAVEKVCNNDGKQPELVVLRGSLQRRSRETPAKALPSLLGVS